MKIQRVFAVSLLSLSTLTVVGAQNPIPGSMTIGSMAWVSAAVNTNASGGELNVNGRNLSNVSVAKLVSAGTREEYDLDVVRTTATTAVVRLREVSIARPLIPPGIYHLRLGAPGNTALSAGTIIVDGLRVLSFTTLSVQSPLRIDFWGLSMPDLTLVGALLRDQAGNEWRTAQVHRDPNDSGRWISQWSPVPVGRYDLFLLGNADRPLWKSPLQFRVFANPR